MLNSHWRVGVMGKNGNLDKNLLYIYLISLIEACCGVMKNGRKNGNLPKIC